MSESVAAETISRCGLHRASEGKMIESAEGQREVDSKMVDQGREIESRIREDRIRSLKFKRWLTTEELALYLDTTIDGIKGRRKRRSITPKKLDSTNYYDREEIDRRLESFGSILPSGRGRKRI